MKELKKLDRDTDMKTIKKQELGPRQRAWVESLRKHPERQMAGALGKRESRTTYKACCLGEAVCVMARRSGKKLPFNEKNDLEASFGANGVLDKNEIDYYKFRDTHGALLRRKIYVDGEQHDFLASANDAGATWPQIADFIESHPKAVFTEPA